MREMRALGNWALGALQLSGEPLLALEPKVAHLRGAEAGFFGNFFDGEAAEVLHFNNSGDGGVDYFETVHEAVYFEDGVGCGAGGGFWLQ